MRRLALLLLSSCSLSVDYTGTYFECGEGDTCPDGYVCKAQVCIPTEPAPQTCSRAIASGDGHTCMIREPDGSIWCWGRNSQGQLGNGSIVDSTLPVQVPGIAGATSVVAGSEFTCALVDGGVQCWGANMAGQLGDNSNTPSRDPITVQGLTGVTAIATGSQHTCALVGGGVQCWGDNGAGQLGDTTTAQHRIPAAVTGISNATAISAAGSTSCAITGGKLACWGSNHDGQFMTGTTADQVTAPETNAVLSNVTGVAVGSAHVCVIANGGVSCGGNGGAGQLGNGELGNTSNPTDTVIPAQIESIYAGFDNTCVIDSQDRTWCWGSANEGKLFFGEGVFVSSSRPVITAFEPAESIAMGGAHTCLRTIDGAISCVGINAQGQLGNGTRTTEPNPIAVDGLSNVAAIASGDRFSCATTMAGETSCWGNNSDGQLGNGGFETASQPTPALVEDVAKLHTGTRYVCAEHTNGTISCWGDGDAGQLGNGSSTRGIPLTIPGVTGVDALTLGDDHSCFLTGGSIKCFGDNTSGKLGDAAAPAGPDPVALNNGLTGTLSGVAAADRHTCVIDSAKNVQCWGVDDRGTLGRANGMPGNFSDPVPATVKLKTDTAAPLANIDEIASRGNTVFARQGGKLFAWGNTCPNVLGSSGISFCSQDSASEVDNISNAKSLAIGFGINCVLKEDGGISCWGNNQFGQIGDGTYNFTFPISVPGLTGVIAVAPGSDHVCAIKSDRTVACWGNAGSGQLGNRVVDDRGPAFVRLTCEGD